MRIAIEKDILKKKIVDFIKNGNFTFVDNKAIIYGEELKEPSFILRMCSLLLCTDNKAYWDKASEIIKCMYLGGAVCHFSPMIASRILIEYCEKIDGGARKRIKDYLLYARSALIGDELDYIGVNDNFPLMATYAVMTMSKIFDDAELKAEADKKFRQLEALLKRRGVISEYNSLAYTPLQLFVLASIAKSAFDDRHREIAINAQRRVWFDLISHFHRTTGEVTGPYSRHYAPDNPSNCKMFFKLLLENCEQELKVNDEYTMNYVMHQLYFLSEDFDIDEAVLDLYYNKKYPFEFKATTEYSASTDATPEAAKRDMSKEEDVYEYSAGTSGLYTYQTKDYGSKDR